MTKEEFRAAAVSRLASAKALLAAAKPDEAAEYAGYALEFQLKARIMDVNGWKDWPSGRKEFRKLGTANLHVHDLSTLLAASGRESLVKPKYMVEWSSCVTWTPEARYQPIGSVAIPVAENLVRDVETLLGVL